MTVGPCLEVIWDGKVVYRRICKNAFGQNE